MSDVTAAIRGLWKSPGFSLVAILTIAVGIGANTALFSVYDRLVLNPVTIPNPSSLVAIWTNNPQLTFNAPVVMAALRGDPRQGDCVFFNRHLRVRQLQAHRKRRAGAAERPAGQRHVPADAWNSAGAGTQLHGGGGSAERWGRLHHLS
jgi:hypothetical protein